MLVNRNRDEADSSWCRLYSAGEFGLVSRSPGPLWRVVSVREARLGAISLGGRVNLGEVGA